MCSHQCWSTQEHRAVLWGFPGLAGTSEVDSTACAADCGQGPWVPAMLVVIAVWSLESWAPLFQKFVVVGTLDYVPARLLSLHVPKEAPQNTCLVEPKSLRISLVVEVYERWALFYAKFRAFVLSSWILLTHQHNAYYIHPVHRHATLRVLTLSFMWPLGATTSSHSMWYDTYGWKWPALPFCLSVVLLKIMTTESLSTKGHVCQWTEHRGSDHLR